jgi:hypothetical protein
VAGAKVQLVNGTAYSAEVLKTAIVATSDGGKLDLQVARGAPTQESSVAWRGVAVRDIRTLNECLGALRSWMNQTGRTGSRGIP